MDIVSADTGWDDIAARVASLVPAFQDGAPAADARSSFPVAEVAALRDCGALAVPLPVEQDLPAASSASAGQLVAVLMQTGRGNLAVGRILEAHVNARHLIGRYGDPAQKRKAAADVAGGHLFALWVTDPPDGGLRVSGGPGNFRLSGRKMFCSAAGYATRALVTASNEAGEARMIILELGRGERVAALPSPLQGMRAAVTGAVDFSGCSVDHDAFLGLPGDYLREPDFSAGAWRGSAVAVGGLCSLVESAKDQLQSSGRIDSAHQQARLGRVMIAYETSRLWLGQVAQAAEALPQDPHYDPAGAVAYVGLARIAIEAACLDAMQLVQRSLGLSAFRQGNPVERICRDLATYLRQPAPDEVLTEAACHFARHSTVTRP